MNHVVRTDDGAITVTDGALAQIVMQAVEAVEGVRVRRRPRRRLTLDLDNARVDVGLTVAYGLVLPDVAQDVQQNVSDAVARMLGVELRAVDVTIEELDA
jgi:uncharacterized alkaline shock family protein YloU